MIDNGDAQEKIWGSATRAPSTLLLAKLCIRSSSVAGSTLTADLASPEHSRKMGSHSSSRLLARPWLPRKSRPAPLACTAHCRPMPKPAIQYLRTLAMVTVNKRIETVTRAPQNGRKALPAPGFAESATRASSAGDAVYRILAQCMSRIDGKKRVAGLFYVEGFMSPRW